jgi:hypothetical protein
MQIDEELRRVLLNLLGIGLLRIRVLGWAGRADDCACEADHLHNPPRTATDLTMEELKYYDEIERPVFIKRAKELNLNVEEFEPVWSRLGEILVELESEGASNRITARRYIHSSSHCGCITGYSESAG